MFLNLVSQSAFYLLYLDPFTFIDMLSVYIIFCLPFILVFVVVVVVSVVFFLPFHGLFENFQNSILSILFSSTSLCITTFYLQLQLLYGYNFSYLLLTFYQFKLSEESLTPLCVCVCVCVLSHSVVSYSATSQTVACQAPLFMEFSRQEYWRGQPFPSPGDLPDLGRVPKPESPALQVDSLPSEHQGSAYVSLLSLIYNYLKYFLCIYLEPNQIVL